MIPRVGDACTFYHEGGAGERRWVAGWRYGVIRAIPRRGRYKGWAHVEIPVKLRTLDGKIRPFVRTWVHLKSINAVGDFTYHGNEAEPETKPKQRPAR